MGQRRDYRSHKEPVDRNSSPIRSTESDWRATDITMDDREKSRSKCNILESRDAISKGEVMLGKIRVATEGNGSRIGL